MTVGRGSELDSLFEAFVEHLVVHGARLDLAELCRHHLELLAPLERRVACFDEVDDLLSARKRLPAGAMLGPYRIVSLLGEGAMGCVYVALDSRTDRRIALKTCPAGRVSDLETRRRFEREAAVIAALDHPNIVHCLSIEEHAGCLFLTMELVEGETLASTLPATMSPDQLLGIARSLAAALRAAHDRGIVHRDLKPSNLMLTRDGQLKVLDFGLAHLRVDDGESITRTGSVLGTIPYMAPEQLLGEKADPRSDLYSFGAVVYELAAGRRPFVGHHIGELLAAIFDRTPEPLLTLRSDLPPVLVQLVERCLAREPGDRPRDAAELVSLLG